MSKKEKEEIFLIEWGEVKQELFDLYAGKETPTYQSQGAHRSSVESWKGSRDWTGCTLQQMAGPKGYLINGFARDEFDVSRHIPARKKRAIKFDEEGEMQLDLVYSGHDYPFLAWEQRERKPGMRLMVDYAFACGVPIKTIAEYGGWVARLCGSFEAAGYDLEVDVRITLDGLFQNDRGKRRNLIIRVKEANEVSDFTGWSALFSPGGFRMCGFTALAMYAHKQQAQLDYCYGLTTPTYEWDMAWDETIRSLWIKCPQRASGPFSEDLMDQKFQDLGLL